MKSKRTKACEITKQTRMDVALRDNGLCIFCGGVGIPNAHFIKRSQGGLGIEQNIFSACVECHHEQDFGKNSKEYTDIAEKYLKSKYDNWNKEELIYKKWRLNK